MVKIGYSEDISLTKKFSKISDARLIWGGDQTMKNQK